MELSSASMLDEGTAAAEAMTLLQRVNKKNRSNTFLIADDCHPQTIAVVRTRAEALGFEVAVGQPDALLASTDAFGLLLQYPGTYGHLDDLCAVDRVRARGEHAGRGGGGYHGPAAGEAAGRDGRRRGGGQHAALRRADGIRRAARGLLRHARRVQAFDAGAHHRRVHRPARQPGAAHGDADAGATHPPGESHQQHLHRAGAAGRDGGVLRHVPRAAGLAAHRHAHPAFGLHPRQRAGRRRFHRRQRHVFRHPHLHRGHKAEGDRAARAGAGPEPAHHRQRPAGYCAR